MGQSTLGSAPAPSLERAIAGVHEITVTVEGQPARVFVGGQGERILLVHGGWGGATMHWASVWNRLAKRFAIIAPDLPGIGRTDQPALGSVVDYAHWLEHLMDALEAPSAWCVGNSFGASVACALAAEQPERCRGLVLVNGFPMPETPRPMRWLGERGFGHRLLRAIERYVAYSPAALGRGFFNPARAPEELRDLVHMESPPQVDAFVEILVHGGGPDRRPLAPTLLWGANDRLLGTRAKSARKLHASWPGSRLIFVPGAGHMPQVENPAAFVDGLISAISRP